MNKIRILGLKKEKGECENGDIPYLYKEVE